MCAVDLLSRSLRFFGIAAAVGLAVSCGSGGDYSGSGGNGDGGNGGDQGLIATFGSIQINVLDQLCVSCHIGATAPAGLRLDAANSYALLVGIASTQAPALLRVEPGNPADSYLIRKLEGTAGTGARMPLNGQALAAADIAVIRQWITDGAMRDPEPPPSAPLRVTSLSPLPDSTELQMPLSIMAMFDRELDANTVNETTFLVERSGGDGSFGDGNDVAVTPLSVTVASANSRLAVLDMSTTPAAEDTYRVTLVGTGAAVIADLDANALDGEFSGTLPSGDGTAGGNFVAEFVVLGVQPTLQSIQENVFTTICAACHTGPSSNVLPAGLDLSTLEASFASLVGVASLQAPSLSRVATGDADNSYLVQKLEGTAADGGRMPLFGMALDQATIDAIREWIDNGAIR